jgi:hypothetical protein
MGILRRMANTIAALKDTKPEIFDMIRSHLEQSQWQAFVTGELAEANKLEHISISGGDLKLPFQNTNCGDLGFMNNNHLQENNMSNNVIITT